MDNAGVLRLLCVTTDPEATTFFGFAYAADYSATTSKPQLAVLVRSNTNPSSEGDLTWSVVSKVDGSKLNGYPGAVTGFDYSCAINAELVFTVFGRHATTLPYTDHKVPFGIRYTPTGAMEPRFGYNGLGVWTNISVSEGLNWSESFNRRSLGYVGSGATTKLVHAVISETSDNITLAIVNESTMTLEPAAVWKTDASIHGASIQALEVDTDYLYTYGLGLSNTIPPFLSRFPLATISQTIPESTRYDTSSTITNSSTACFKSPTPIVYVSRGSLTLICGNRRYGPNKSAFYKILTPSTSIALSPAVEFDADVIEMEYFVPIGAGSGASTFGLIRKYNEMYAFGNDGDFRYTHLVSDIKVSDTLTSNPYPVVPTPDPSPESTRLSARSIIGNVAGAVVVLAGIVFLLVRRYRNRRKSKDKNATSTLDNEKSASDEGDNSSISSKKIGENDDNHLFLEGKYPDSNSSRRERREPSSTDNLPMAPTTPVPEHLQEQLKELQAEMRALQDRISQATQFSSHPRPNYVTTVSYDRPQPKTATTTTATTGTSDLSEPQTRVLTTSKGSWEPTPFVPPVGSSLSMDMHSPSAPAYSSVVAQSSSSSQDSPDLVPQDTDDSPPPTLSPSPPPPSPSPTPLPPVPFSPDRT